MKRVALVLLFISFGSPTLADKSSFSEVAFEKVKPTVQEILKHPFNVELANGTLPKAKYDYYLAQDIIYLVKFARALELLAAKLKETADIKFIKEMVAACLAEHPGETAKVVEMSKATRAYTQYLLEVAENGTKQELAAALLPCFWIYLKVAQTLVSTVKPDSPYAHWFKQYSGAAYQHDVTRMVKLTNKLAKQTSPEMRTKMMAAFVKASNFELEFWDAGYKGEN